MSPLKGYISFYKNNLKIKLIYDATIQKNHIKATHNIIDKWYEWGKNAGYIDAVSLIEFKEKEAEFNITFSSDISDMEDTIALLIIITGAHKRKTKICSIDILDSIQESSEPPSIA